MTAPDLSQRLDALFAGHDRRDGPGAVVGIAHRGRTVYRAAFGLANVEHRVAMGPATRVSLCSVTKHMACAAVLQLAHDGKLALDDPIGRWVPELDPAAHAPTLHQLMTHTGGVRCHLDVNAFNGVTPHPQGTPLKTLLRQRSVNFAPGQGMAYCNGGYALLSYAIERGAGMPFEQAMSQLLFEPLRLDATASPRHWWPLPEHLATYHLPLPGGGWKHGIGFEEEMLAGGSVVSSVDDVLRWARHLRTADGPVSLRALTPALTLADGSPSSYAYGLTEESWRGVRVVEHGGGGVGASCHLLWVPEEDLELFVFFNSVEPAHTLARQAAALVLGDRLAEEPAARPIPFAAHAALAGQFANDRHGIVLGFGDAGGQLGVSSYGGPAAPILQHRGDAAGDGALPFCIPSALGPRLLRAPASTTGDPVPRIELLEAGLWLPLERVDGPAPAPAELLQALGDAGFHSEEAAATLRFFDDGGELAMHSCGEFGVWTFHPRALDADRLVFSFYKGVGSWLALLHRDAAGRVDALTLSSGRTRGLRFERRGC